MVSTLEEKSHKISDQKDIPDVSEKILEDTKTGVIYDYKEDVSIKKSLFGTEYTEMDISYKTVKLKSLESFDEFTSLGKLFAYIPLFNGEVTMELYSMISMYGMLLISGVYAVFGSTYGSLIFMTILFAIIAFNVGSYILNPTSNIWTYADNLINQLKNNGFLNFINYMVSKIKNNVYNLIWIFSKSKSSNEDTKDNKKNADKLLSNKFEFTEDMKKMNIFIFNKDANKKLGDVLNTDEKWDSKNDKILELIKEFSKK
jgi:hypothetical protein